MPRFVFLLAGVQDIDGLEPDRVAGLEGFTAVRATITRTSEPGSVDREAHPALHQVGETLQIRLA